MAILPSWTLEAACESTFDPIVRGMVSSLGSRNPKDQPGVFAEEVVADWRVVGKDVERQVTGDEALEAHPWMAGVLFTSGEGRFYGFQGKSKFSINFPSPCRPVHPTRNLGSYLEVVMIDAEGFRYCRPGAGGTQTPLIGDWPVISVDVCSNQALSSESALGF